MFNGKPERVNSGSCYESDNLTSASLSAYDCNSEREDGWNDISSEDSDDEMRGTHRLGLTNLKFQLNAAKAGEYYSFYLMDSTSLTVFYSPE